MKAMSEGGKSVEGEQTPEIMGEIPEGEKGAGGVERCQRVREVSEIGDT